MADGIEVGKCDVCKKENVQLNRLYYRYDIKCECHSPQHFEIARHCNDCEPVEPKETRVTYRTTELKRL